MSNNREAKVRLFRESSRCYWCGCVTIIGPDGRLPGSRLVPVPKNLATVDHLYSRLDVRRLCLSHKRRLVLACYACNNRRASEEQRELNHLSRSAKVLVGELMA